jgi:predicted DNA binding CopG/RHH family protein
VSQNLKNLEIALEKIEILKLEKKHLKQKVDNLSKEIYKLKNPSLYPNKTMGVPLNRILQDAEDAMKRYGEKLRKEGLKYAKQKQSKG